MSKKNNRFVRLCAAAAATLALAGTAEAIDVRSWDQKINDVTKRFVVLASFNYEAVLDKETQLVWQRSPTIWSGPQNWVATYCADSVIGGRRGWRLPSLHEMTSLTNPNAADGTLALPAGHPFVGVKNNPHWTATRVHGSTTLGYVVLLNKGGAVLTSSGASLAYQWCVRGGGPISEY